MEIVLKDSERIDDLGCNNLKIIQDKNGFCFGMDSVLIADFAKEIKDNSTVVDLGTGTGIIATLLCGKINPNKVIGVEVQEEVCQMAKKSICLNKLEEKFEIINANVKDIENVLENNSLDAVVSNPPYKKMDTGMKNENYKRLVSRHEVEANLEDFVKAASKLLKAGGAFYMVHRPERLADIISYLREYKLEPKKLRIVQPKEDKQPNLVLIKAVKYAKPFLQIERPLIVYKDNGEYTDEVLKIYNLI